MQLSEFIESTIFEIALGVARSKVACKDLISVSPGSLNGNRREQESTVDFDVALKLSTASTSSAQAEGSAKAKLRIMVVDADVSLGGQKSGSETDASEQTHRVSFSVPVFLNAHHRADPAFTTELVEVLRQFEDR